MKKSTITILKKHGLRFDRFIHHYVYFTFYHSYIRAAVFLFGLLEHLTWCKPLAAPIDAIYERFHAKFISWEDTRKILTLDEDLSAVSDKNKRIIPFKYANKIVFNDPTHIAVMDCPCKATMPPYESVNCCIAVGREITSFWLEHCEKYNVRKINQVEALDIVSAFRKTGHVTQAFFKVATGGSTGVICNCRPECCISLKASRITQKLHPDLVQTASSGYSVQLDLENCQSCGDCIVNCHADALKMGEHGLVYDRDACFGCGLCVEFCPNGVLSLYQDSDKPLPLDVDLVRAEFAN